MNSEEPPSTTPIAWRCEQDRKLHPATESSFVIYIEEVQSAWHGLAVRRHSYFVRRMIVCRPCRRQIANMEGDADGRERPAPPADGQSTESMGVSR